MAAATGTTLIRSALSRPCDRRNKIAHETGVRNGPTIQDLEKGDYNQIWEWNKTVPAAISNLVHKLIHDNVEVNPGAPAVCSWDGNLTYAELNDLSSRLADEPKSRGVGPEVIVPLSFKKSA